MGNIVIARANEAVIISGWRKTRVFVGKGGMTVFGLERVSRLPLDLIQVEVKSVEAETSMGVRVNVDGVCCLKIQAWVTKDQVGIQQNFEVEENEEVEGTEVVHGHTDNQLVLDEAQIILAAQHFLGKSRAEVVNVITKVLEGHQRQILGTLTVEELYRDRQAFSQRVKGHTSLDLHRMGFVLVSYTVAKIFDSDGYMEALGATQASKVKREAEEGTARNVNASREEVAKTKARADVIEAEYLANAHVSADEHRMRQNEADLSLELRKAAIDAEVFRARAKAEKAGVIESEEQQKTVATKRAEQQAAHALVMVQVAQNEALEKLRASEGQVQVARQRADQDVVEAEGKSLAFLMETKHQAEALRVRTEQEALCKITMGQAEAQKIREVGEAEATVLKANLQAEAAGLRSRADAYSHMGEAGVMSMMIKEMPRIAEAIAKPLESTDRMVFISNDGHGPSNMVGDVCNMMTKIPMLAESITGLDLKTLVNKMAGQGQGMRELPTKSYSEVVLGSGGVTPVEASADEPTSASS